MNQQEITNIIKSTQQSLGSSRSTVEEVIIRL